MFVGRTDALIGSSAAKYWPGGIKFGQSIRSVYRRNWPPFRGSILQPFDAGSIGFSQSIIGCRCYLVFEHPTMVAGGITPGAFPALVARRPVNIFTENCSVAKIRCN